MNLHIKCIPSFKRKNTKICLTLEWLGLTYKIMVHSTRVYLLQPIDKTTVIKTQQCLNNSQTNKQCNLS
jgi:hypothetical protein